MGFTQVFDHEVGSGSIAIVAVFLDNPIDGIIHIVGKSHFQIIIELLEGAVVDHAATHFADDIASSDAVCESDVLRIAVNTWEQSICANSVRIENRIAPPPHVVGDMPPFREFLTETCIIRM